MSEIYSSIACNLDAHILQASLPLFEQEKVEAIEWSFDTLFKVSEIPAWFTDLVKEFSNHNRLIGHGVYFSLFSGKWSPGQQEWLDKLQKLASQFHFDHITEHFGFMTGEDFHKGAPISIPFTAQTLALGKDRLQRIQDACKCPVGLENLAFSYSLDEVKKHGDFLAQLVESVNGFVILDLHNIYCQVHNFNIDFDDIIKLYPLERVREMHISGGSWDETQVGPGRQVRRDTHDESVPEAVFEFLHNAIPKCPNLKYVVMEQMGTALDTLEKQAIFQSDFLRMDSIIKRLGFDYDPKIENTFTPLNTSASNIPLEDHELYKQQLQLSHILETAGSISEAQAMLRSSSLNNTAWEVDKWAPYMLQTAISIAQKWKNGFA
ncbi:multinuclear nonheme iron-dependent oxidase [Dyadobacter fanqingshengii]|uniref:DUF692 domain-containing protein n=1 Tax=Dyadobacter fanqingshengii TaxID=2906443 RepID=A0A9X1PCZ4_9BACT|nr:DUF692 family multinuclear iron-containing protein [Dyadobacter fanqingshengii]MCF0042894.1 DUF692 domain-containing protein [Dyadobacter fanqingshengii]USJ35450.1 DUF692 domain-containing protein [Dyadobacter fanqingshengii]